MPTPSRRAFLKTATLATATAVWSARSWARVIGANEDVRVAVVGLNGRGRNHLTSLRAVPGVRIAAICDVDTAVLDRVAAELAKDGIVPAKFTDVRQLLASPDVDAITIATPNHWHSLMGIWACQAGKDAYVEKPVSHNIWEGRQLVAAAAKYDRVVQAGMQIRSGEGLQEAVDWVRAGNLGKIKVARGFCYKRRKSIGRSDRYSRPPTTVNYDLWLGPAPMEQPYRARFHYDWHWIYAYGDGDLGNQGVHQVDVARWFLGESGVPTWTCSVGGRLGYTDDGETPNTQVIHHRYKTAPLIFEVRGLPATYDPTEAQPGQPGADAAGNLAATMDKYRGVNVGNVIDCEGGSVVTNGYFAATAYDGDGKVVRTFKGEDRMMQNFIDVVRSRKKADLYGPIQEGHLSSVLCHLGTISHRLGRAQLSTLKQQEEDVLPSEDALRRLGEHLAANQIDLAKTPLTLGLPLVIDPARNSFSRWENNDDTYWCKAGMAFMSDGDIDRANALLKPAYRDPYTIPQLAGFGAPPA